ncbi:hypothetical protein [Methylacidimicrobium tartarophylax]|uniref:Uncharacterized protein n=1 Tax=Methylacidimicrobium tartarophylax TaxID=1041768 RepID=A0A5E6M9Q4_9BACT|nr:hypothetical protein [Methylacidimicrobium tartarophylax]VVM04472.1 hypothetical protein MAMT_00105 [Methylacidimicrobium tartarophylax]
MQLRPSHAVAIAAIWLALGTSAWASKAYWYDIQAPRSAAQGPVIKHIGPEYDEKPGIPIYLRGTPARYHILGAIYIDETRLISSTWRPVERVAAAHGGHGVILFTKAEKKRYSRVSGDLSDQLWVWCYR